MTNPALRLEGVGVDYVAFADRGRLRRRKVTVPALKAIDLECLFGEVVGVIGDNGSGKSTMLQVMAGLLPPTRGQVLSASQPQLLGVHAAVNQRLSGRQNVELCSLALGHSPAELAKITAQVEDFSELGHFLDLPVQSYSSGMRQRLAFSISIMASPRILLIDEALAVGDTRFRNKCLAKLDELRSAAGLVVMATHVMVEIRDHCTRAIRVADGNIVADGPPDKIIADYLQTR